MNKLPLLLLILILIACRDTETPTPTVSQTEESFTLSPSIEAHTPTIRPTEVVESTPSIVVGSMEYTEQRILGALVVQLLRANGFEVTDRTGLGGSRAVRQALENGEISLYPELTGTALSLYQNIPAENLPKSAERTYQLAKSLDTSNGLIWLQPSQFDSSYVLLVRDGLVQQGVTSIAGLAKLIDNLEQALTLCVEAEFLGRRQDGLASLLEVYNLNFGEDAIMILPLDEVYAQLRAGGCDVSVGSNSDGRITAWNLNVLEDSAQFFPFYQAAPVVSAELLTAYPAIESVLTPLFVSLDQATMRHLNALVDIGGDGLFDTGDEKPISEVATSYLELTGLIGDAPLIRIGALDSAEGKLLANLTAQTLARHGFRTMTQRYASSQLVRQALTGGAVDIAWENTARSLIAFHSVPLDTIPNQSQAVFDLIASLDTQYNDLTWLAPTEYDNKLVAVLQPEIVEAIGNTDNLADFIADRDDFILCVDAETYGLILPSSEAAYGIIFAEEQVRVLNTDDLLTRVRDNDCTMAVAYSADSQIAAFGLAELPDPNGIFPASNSAPVVTQALLEQHPVAVELLTATFPYIDLDTMLEAQAQIDVGADGVSRSGDEISIDAAVNVILAETPLFSDLPTIRIVAEPLTEPLLMAELTKALLVDKGFEAEISADARNTPDLYAKIQNNLANIAWSYTGAALTEQHDVQPVPSDPQAAFQTLQTLDADVGLQWLNPTAFNDTYTLLYDPTKVDINLQSFRDLANYMNVNDSPFTLCVDKDFFLRPDGLQAIEAAYGFRFDRAKIEQFSFRELQRQMHANSCDLAQGYRTDGRVVARGYVTLSDPLKTLPTFSMAALTTPVLLSEYPQIGEAINELMPLLEDDVMANLNARVAVGEDGELYSGDEISADIIARAFLCQENLIRRTCSGEAALLDEPVDAAEVAARVGSPLANGCTLAEINGGFEEQANWYTPITRSSARYSPVQTHTGDWAMQLGATTDREGLLESFSIAQQVVQLPEGAVSAEIDLYYYSISHDAIGGDYAGLYIFDAGLTTTKTIFDLPFDPVQRWTHTQFDLSPYLGDSIALHFLVINDGDSIPSTVFIDDVRLQICYATE